MSEKPSEKPSASAPQEILKASLANDVNLIVNMFADDAIVLPPNDTTLFGKDEIRSWWEDYFSFFRITSVVQTEQDVTVAGNQAFERQSFSATIVPNERGARILDDIRSLVVWRRQA